jgi:hypothetical protein
MAAPIAAVNWYDSINLIYTNLHAFQEIGSFSNAYVRLDAWRQLFFPVFTRWNDVVGEIDPRRGPIVLRWSVPTIALLNSSLFPNGPNTTGIRPYQMDPIINLVQQTVWSAAFFPLTATQEADIVTAFNSSFGP